MLSHFIFIFFVEMKSQAHCDDELEFPASFKHRFGFLGWRKISICRIYIFIYDSWGLFGGPFGSDVRKNIHLAISSSMIRTHKPGNRLRAEDNTNMASDFYAELVNTIY